MSRGGARPNAGIKPRNEVPAKNRSIKFTDAEWEAVKQKAQALNMTASDYVRSKALAD